MNYFVYKYHNRVGLNYDDPAKIPRDATPLSNYPSVHNTAVCTQISKVRVQSDCINNCLCRRNLSKKRLTFASRSLPTRRTILHATACSGRKM